LAWEGAVCLLGGRAGLVTLPPAVEERRHVQMQCPKCGVNLREREKGSIIIDICPQCQGIWLDAGELEKLSQRETRYYDEDDDDDDWDDDDDRRGRRGDDRDRRYERERGYDRERVGAYGQPRKKKGFLSSMMESFGGGEGGMED
jgi:Zn-finger nucleic acid-binding protein